MGLWIVLVLIIALVILLNVQLARLNRAAPASLTYTAQPDTVELLTASPAGWQHHSWRPDGHKDIAEALRTPGFAVRRNGAVEEARA